MGVAHDSKAARLVTAAYIFSAKCHAGQLRKSGEPYLMHPLEVSYILADLGMDGATVCTGLLHDTVEDTYATIEEINDQFGERVAMMVDGVTKISQIEFTTAAEKAADNFRKMVVAMTRDLRVLIVKLADRLHNMRTLEHMKPEKQRRIARETMDIYAPLADRLGMNALKTELQDLSFRYLQPNSYEQMRKDLDEHLPARDRYVAETVGEISAALDGNEVKIVKIYGRAKHLYSIFMKLEKKGVSLAEIYDAVAFRVIVTSLADCYAVLGNVHAKWRPIPGRFKDFVALPKQNGYKSLHTTVVGPNRQLIEIQIRTEEMDITAERGLAAHYSYKEGDSNSQGGKAKAPVWLDQLMEWQDTVRDPNEFMESVRHELFHEEVFVFTPKGGVVQLPRGATCVDFAFSVHTEVGLTCSGAKVNGRMVPLRSKLKSGDRVEVLTDKRRTPNREWLDFVVTSRARTRIRTAVRKREQEQAREVGENLLDRALRANGSSMTKLQANEDLQDIANRLKQFSFDEVLAQIGLNKLATDAVVQLIFPVQATLPPEAVGEPMPSLAQRLFGRKSKPVKHGSSVVVGGLDDVFITFANCCSPLPGERIVGHVSSGRGVRVHRLGCNELHNADPARQVEVRWRGGSEILHQVRLRVITDDKPGILAHISSAFENLDINISEATCKVRSDGSALNTFRFGVFDLGALDGIRARLRKLNGVSRVERI
jgi:guanosine-3',5'-bis(diphosphate) 3'-pyrophosphohydrolase